MHSLRSRPAVLLICSILVVCLTLLAPHSATPTAYATSFVVNSTADAVNANPGNGVCETAVPGQCTLRAAIQEANALAGSHTIILPAGTYLLTIPGTSEDAAATGDLDITGDLKLIGDGAATTIVDGNGLDRVFEINNSASVLIEGITIQGGFGDGSWHHGSTGGIFVSNESTVTIVDAVIRDNMGGAAALYNHNSSTTLLRTTVTANGNVGSSNVMQTDANGAAATATLDLVNSTFSGNVGSAVNNTSNFGGLSTLEVRNSTIAYNSFYGIRHLNSAQTPTNATNSIITNNGDGDECSAPLTSSVNNLVGNATCGPSLGVVTGFDAVLADNDGPTPTHALLAGSNAIDAGVDDCLDHEGFPLLTDQRGIPRPQGPVCDIGAYEFVPPDTFIVNSTADGVNANPGNGVCETAVPGQCTLRAAIQEANALPGPDTIILPAGIYTLTIGGTSENAVSGDLDITDDLVINGSGSGTIVNANGLDRAFDVKLGVTADFNNFTIREGVANPGGAILSAGDTTITDMIFYDNQAPTLAPEGQGGAVHAEQGQATIVRSQFADNYASFGGGAVSTALTAVMTISDSTFTGNSSIEGGGAIYFNGPTASVSSSTFVANSAGTGGAIHSNAASVTVTNSTFVANSAVNGGGIDARLGLITVNNSTFLNNVASNLGNSLTSQWSGAGGLLQVWNSIIASQTTNNCNDLIIDLGHNLSWPPGNNCPGSQLDPLLGTLGDNGGHTQTVPLLPGSPAVNAGNNATCEATDQRGVPRPQGFACDVGAYEFVPSDMFVVNSTADTVNANPGNGVCETAVPGQCTLRAAIQEANALAGQKTIILPAGVYTLTIPGTNEDAAATGDLDIMGELTITGAGQNETIIDGNTLDRVFDIRPGATATLSDLTIRNGQLNAAGGGIRNLGELNLTGVTVADNNSTNHGGGIWNEHILTITDSILSGNYSDSFGGGLFNRSDGTAVIRRSLIADNEAFLGGGGAIANFGNLTLTNSTLIGNAHVDEVSQADALYHDGTTSLNNVTFADNFLDGGTAIYHAGGGPLSVSNSIIVATNCAGDPLVDLGNNLSWPAGNNCPGTLADPLLLPLADYGGPTPSLALNLGSPARNAGNAATCEATDQRGVPRPMQLSCDIGAWEATGVNTTWENALSLTPGGLPLVGESVNDVLTAPGQSRWYKFRVAPGSTVALNLSNLPANYDLTLFGDIQATYDRLTTPQDISDLTLLTAEFAPDAYAPDAYAPDAYAPDAYAPDAYAPDAYAPDAYAPDAYAPDAYAPDAYAPDAYAPDAYAPDAYAPDAYAPDTYAPDAYAPDAYAPDAYAPDAYAPELAYTSAQVRSIIAVSALAGTADEFILVNTWDNDGEFYVRVRGRNGTFDPGQAFTLTAEQFTGFCGEVQLLPAGPPSFVPHAGDYDSIILTDLDRMGLSAAEKADLQNRLNALAARPEVNGVVVDLHDSLAALNAQADLPENTQCPFAKNLVARAIKDIIDDYRSLNGDMEYIVLIGNDDAIPFFRHPDRALLANEKNYRPPVQELTTSFGSLALGYVLSQDAYGSDMLLPVGNTSLPIPGLAVGRLVETYAEIINMLDAYEEVGGALPQPQSALVTGYDFLVDATDAITDLYTTGLGSAPNTLIAPREFSPLDPNTWTADDLRDVLFSSRHDLVFLAGHFSANSALAADYQSRMTTHELVSSNVDLRNALVYSPGCHSGYNIVNNHAIPNLTNDLDWAQAFAQKGAVFVAGTGYQYGDTDFLEYSERLYVYFTQQLMADTGAPVPLGQALMAAKRDYLARTPEMRGLHEKSMLQITLFGLPMMTLDMPNRLALPTIDPLNPTPQPTSGNPGLTLGLASYDATIGLPATAVTRTLQSVSSDDTLTAVYYEGSDGVVANPAEPVLPLTLKDASVNGTVLRGIGFRGGSYIDLLNVAPLTGAPTTEIRGVHAPFQSAVYFPIRPWRVNYFDALAGGGGATHLALLGAQFRSNGSSAYHGTLRVYDEMSLRLYYSNNTEQYGDNIPALAAPPSIDQIEAATAADGQSVTFRARATGDASAGIQEVWITYTFCDEDGACSGQWQSLDLTQDALNSAFWEGVLSLNGQDAAQLRFMVQAANGVGLVSLATNLGAYYRSDVDPANPTGAEDVAQPSATTALNLTGPAGAAYSTQATFTAVLTADNEPLANQPVIFALGSQQRTATTDSSGTASVTIPILTNPGPQEIQATFAGAPGFRATAVSQPFLVSKQATQIGLAPANPVIDEGTDSGLTATLTDAAGNRLREKSLFFVVSNNDGPRYTRVLITNFVGEVALGSLPLPAGSYLVTAYFSGDVPALDPANPVLSLSDPNYLASQTSTNLTIETAVLPNQPPQVGPITAPLEPMTLNTTITASATYSDPNSDDTLTAVWHWGDGNTTTQVLPDTSGTASASHTYAAAGVYTIQLTVTDAAGETAVATFEYLVVFDASAGFVTGGGWLWSEADACLHDICAGAAGKAHFTTMVRYQNKNATVPTGNVQFWIGKFRLRATSYDWLVVDQANKEAVYSGSGTIDNKLAANGTPYRFMVWVGDGNPDTYRIQIWYEEDGDKIMVYDNGYHQPINGGNIKVH